MAVLEVKSEVYVVDVEGVSPGEPLPKGPTLVTPSISSLVLPLSHYAHATHTTLASLRAPPDFEPLRRFELHLQEEYEGFRRDQV